MADANKVTVDVTTPVGTLSFPHLFASTKTSNDKGEDIYDVQIIIPKSDREGIRTLLSAIQKVGKAKWGDNWRKVRQPLRDGDKEADDLADDGQTKGQKYPERLGCYFINARSTRPVAVVDRARVPIQDPGEVYGGCKGKINITFYPYATQGNSGIGAGLNGVQKIADGEPFGGGAPAVESMFDMLDEDDDFDEFDLDEDIEEEVEEAPAPKRTAKKAAAKKTARRKPEPEPEPEDEDEFDDLDEDEDEDEFDDLDDLDVDEDEDDLYEEDDDLDEDDEDEEPEPEPAPRKRAAAKKAPAKKAAAKKAPAKKTAARRR